MNAQQYLGQYVRLVKLKSNSDLNVLVRWSALSESWRLLDGSPARPVRATGQNVGFLLYPISGDRPFGHAGLFGIRPSDGEAWLGFGLGSRDHWASHVTAEALRLVLRYAFGDLRLRRVLLGVFDYDARKLRAYEQVGFVIQGRLLQESSREGQSRAGLYMALPREEWEVSGSVIGQQ
jgi:RimJ/RimL family protein N-acetyltransferase